MSSISRFIGRTGNGYFERILISRHSRESGNPVCTVADYSKPQHWPGFPLSRERRLAIVITALISSSNSYFPNSDIFTGRPSWADRSAAKTTRWLSKAVSKLVSGIGSFLPMLSMKAWNWG